MERSEAPRDTPWGAAQTTKKIADGLWQVTTAGHGGIYVDYDLRGKLRAQGTPYSGNGWFEEDCDWAIVALSFPQHFDAKTLEAARKTAGSEYMQNILTA